MASIAAKLLSTVNAPYGTAVTAEQLADLLVRDASASSFDVSAFAFFSEVSPELQERFVEEFGVDRAAVRAVARRFSELCGYDLALAA